jgi:hypothetical protein
MLLGSLDVDIQAIGDGKRDRTVEKRDPEPLRECWTDTASPSAIRRGQGNKHVPRLSRSEVVG